MVRAELTDAPGDGLPTPRRYIAALAVWATVFMAVLDGSMANVALPTIAHEFGAAASSAIWIVNAFQLMVVITLLPIAALSEKLGYRQVNIAGSIIFGLGAAVAMLSTSIEMLVVARVVQGVGAAALMSTNSAITRHIFPQRLLGRAIGMNAVIIGVAAALGPTVGSALLAAGPWRLLFGIAVPIAALALALSPAMPTSAREHRPFDLIATVLNALTFGLLILGAETSTRVDPRAGAAMLVGGVAAAVFLVRRELRRPAPLVPVDLLRIPVFGLSIATSIISFLAQMLAFVSLPFYFQAVLGRTAVEAGLLMTPWPLAVILAALLSGVLADRYSAGVLGGIGLGTFSVGLLALALVDPGAGWQDIAWRMALCGAGFGLFQSPNNRVMVSVAPRNRSGAAGGMIATARLLGQTMGALGVSVAFHAGGPGSTPMVLLAGAGLAFAGALVSLSRLRQPDSAHAPEETA